MSAWKRGSNLLAGAGLIGLAQTGYGADVASGRAIVPGKRIGRIYPGEPSKKLMQQLGKSDYSDAATGHYWNSWFGRRRDHKTGLRDSVDVFTTSGNTGRIIPVRSVRVTAPYFVTSSGIRTRTSLAAIRRVYPRLSRGTSYQSKARRDTIDVYDAVRQGIVFEIARGQSDPAQANRCIAITIHERGDSSATAFANIPDVEEENLHPGRNTP